MPLSPIDQQTIERLLSNRFGAAIRIATAHRFPHTHVARCMLEAGPATVPRTVIVRLPRDDLQDAARAGTSPLHNEHIALAFLEGLGSTIAPRYWAGGTADGVLITEDLGAAPSLLDLLLGSAPHAAHTGLLAFARALGTLHAQTIGRATAYDKLRAQHEGGNPRTATHARLTLTERWRQVCDAARQLGLPAPRDVDADVEAIEHTLAAANEPTALSSGDPSVVNCKVTPDSARLFDFEGAHFRHPFIDAVVLYYPYPTGGPPWQLPPNVAEDAGRAYRRELTRACPAMSDNTTYEHAMAAACAHWTITRLTRLPKVDAGPDRDAWLLLPATWSAPPPTRSRRRQLVSTLETCITSTRRAATLSSFTIWCESLLHALRARWPEATEELPLYPAFESAPATAALEIRAQNVGE